MSGRLELAMTAASAGVYEIDTVTGDRWSSEQFQQLAGVDPVAVAYRRLPRDLGKSRETGSGDVETGDLRRVAQDLVAALRAREALEVA